MSTQESTLIRVLLQDSHIAGIKATPRLAANYSHKISSLLAIYRLLDIQLLLRDCAAIPYTLRPLRPQNIQPNTLPSTVKKLWKKLNNWQDVIVRFKNCYNKATSRDEDVIHAAEPVPAFRYTLSHLKGLATSFSDEQLDNIAKNFRVAALHWTFLQEVLPSDKQILPSLPENVEQIIDWTTLDTLLAQFSVGTSNKIRTYLASHNHGKLAFPLHLSLLLTPLFLLMPVNLAGSDFHWESVNFLSIALGNEKPPILALVERQIWIALSSIAASDSSQESIHGAFRELFCSEPFSKVIDMSPTDPAFSFFQAVSPQLCATSTTPQAMKTLEYFSNGYDAVTSIDSMNDEGSTIHNNERLLLPQAGTVQLQADISLPNWDNTSDENAYIQSDAGVTSSIDIEMNADGEIAPPTDERLNNTENDLDRPGCCTEPDPASGNMDVDNGANGEIRPLADGGSDDDNTGDDPDRPGRCTEADRDVNTLNDEEDLSEADSAGGEGNKLSFRLPMGKRIPVDRSSTADVNTETTQSSNTSTPHRRSTRVRKRSKVDYSEYELGAQNKKAKLKSKKVDYRVISMSEESTIKKNTTRWVQIEEDIFVETPVTNLDVSVPSTPKLEMKRLVKAWGPKGETLEFRPSCHDAHTLSTLESLIDRVEEGYKNGKPLYVRGASGQNDSVKESVFNCISEADFVKMSPSDVQEILCKQHIVVTDKKHESVNFQDALLDIAHPSTVTGIQDLTMPNGPLRTRTGTIGDLIEASKSKDSRILNCLGLKLPFAGIEPLPFSSDARALRSVYNQVGWFKGQSLTEHLRWCLAATKDAFHVLHIDSDGYGTFVNVVAGSKWWMVARPKQGSTFEDFNASSFLLDERFGIHETGRDLFDIEAILLQPGSELIMRPNTPHAVYTPEHSVCHGGHFYAMSTMPDSFVALVHTFVCDLYITNATYLESRLVLAAMVSLYHTGLVEDTLMNTPMASHIPDLTKEGSFENILIICNLGVLMNVLCHMTYAPPENDHLAKMFADHASKWEQFDINGLSDYQRKLFCLTRGLSLELILWLNTTYNTGIPDRPIQTLFAISLIDTCKMLIDYKCQFDRTSWLAGPGFTLERLQIQIQAVLTLVKEKLDPSSTTLQQFDWDVNKWELPSENSTGKRMLPCIHGVKVSKLPNPPAFIRLSRPALCILGETVLDRKFASRPTD